MLKGVRKCQLENRDSNLLAMNKRKFTKWLFAVNFILTFSSFFFATEIILNFGRRERDEGGGEESPILYRRFEDLLT